MDFVRQGALVAMALVLMQQPEARVAPFRKQLAKFVADKHEEIMCRCVPTTPPRHAAESWLQTACRARTQCHAMLLAVRRRHSRPRSMTMRMSAALTTRT